MGKGNIFSGKPVFSQIIKLMDRSEINRIADEQHANRYTKRLDAYAHLVIMLYAVLNNFSSLREVVSGFVSAVTRLKHFGMDYVVRRSTLADANKRRPSEFFASVYAALWARYRTFLSDSRPVDAHGKKVFIMDSTTISLFTDVLKCSGRKPKNGKKKGGIKAHTVIQADADTPAFIRLTEATVHDRKVMWLAEKLPQGSYLVADKGYYDYEEWQRLTDRGIFYVTKLKSNAKYTVVEKRDVSGMEGNGLLSDEIIEVTYKRDNKRPLTKEEMSHRRGRKPKSGVVWKHDWRTYKHRCRRIEKLADNGIDHIVFVTNDFGTSANDIGELYRRRWQVETLYKRMKGNFPLKYFLGDSANEIEIQVWATMIAWLLLMVIKKYVTRRKWSFSNMVTEVRILINAYIDIRVFLNDPNCMWRSLIAERERLKKELQNDLFPETVTLISENKRTVACLNAPQDEKWRF